MKLTLQILGYGILSLLVLVILYFILAFILSRLSVPKEAATKPEVSIFILTNGVHTDLVVPVNHPAMNWIRYVKFEHTLGQDTTAPYLAFGWGDKGFYLETPTWADLKVSTALKAGTGLSSSAIHATFYRQMVPNNACKRIDISEAQYKRLVQFILARFDLTEQGESIHIKTDAIYGSNDAFYEAKGSYNLFYTCNTWANQGLKAAGQKACLWTPFYHGIFYQYRNAGE